MSLTGSEVDELDSVAVLQIHGGDGDGASLIFDFNDERIAVSIFPSSSTRDKNRISSSNHLISLLDQATSGSADDDEYDKLLDEVLQVILDAGRPIFKALSSPDPNPKSSSLRDLHSLIYPSVNHFRFIDTCGETAIKPIAPSEAYTLSMDELDFDSSEEDDLGIDTTLPCYSTREIFTLEVFVEGSYIASRVQAGSAEMFCKAHSQAAPLVDTSVGRELHYLQDIRNASRLEDVSTIRIPQLLGYIRHVDTHRIVGFLRQWIPGCRLRDIDITTTSVQRRQKWFAQIREIVDALHDSGVVWGDGKAANVIIDEQDDAWLIDFGGGWTKGWVDEDLADTIEGDKQAIGMIGRFLGID